MQIHELNNFTGTLGANSYVPVDNGTDTGKVSTQQILAATEARIDNIIAGPAPSAEEIVDARLGADGVVYPSLGDAIRDQVTDVKSDLNNTQSEVNEVYTALDYNQNEWTKTAIANVTRTFIPIITNVTLKKGVTYYIEASVPTAISKDIYISLRDSDNNVMYSQNAVMTAGLTEKTFPTFTPTANHTNLTIYGNVYNSSVVSISDVPITATLTSDETDIGFRLLNELSELLPNNQFRYLMFTMAGATTSPSGLIILGSNDGTEFDLYKKMGCYTCENTHTTGGTTYTNSVRDPAIIKIGKYYYIAYTIIGWHNGSAFGLCRTADFVTFEELPNIDLVDADNNPFTRVWAPAWFQDGFNFYITVACESNSVFHMYILDFDPLTENVTDMFDTNIATNDVHWYYSKGAYYALGNDALFTSPTLKSTSYTRIRNSRSGIEGDVAIQLDNGKYRVYAALIEGQLSGVEIGQYVVNDISATSVPSFTAITLTQEAEDYQTELGYMYTHPTIYDNFAQSIDKAQTMILEHSIFDA